MKRVRLLNSKRLSVSPIFKDSSKILSNNNYSLIFHYQYNNRTNRYYYRIYVRILFFLFLYVYIYQIPDSRKSFSYNRTIQTLFFKYIIHNILHIKNIVICGIFIRSFGSVFRASRDNV